jgi:hypothetical protein
MLGKDWRITFLSYYGPFNCKNVVLLFGRTYGHAVRFRSNDRT